MARDSLRGGFVRSALPARTQAGFAISVLAIFAIGFLSYRSIAWRAEGMRLVAHTLEVTRELDGLLSTYKDAETGQRGYLLTGESRYLAPYDAAVTSIDGKVARLRELIADNPRQLERGGRPRALRRRQDGRAQEDYRTAARQSLRRGPGHGQDGSGQAVHGRSARRDRRNEGSGAEAARGAYSRGRAGRECLRRRRPWRLGAAPDADPGSRRDVGPRLPCAAARGLAAHRGG